jgi:hypothetical protein
MSQQNQTWLSQYIMAPSNEPLDHESITQGVFTNEADAVDHVWDYTKQRLIHTCPDLFIEAHLPDQDEDSNTVDLEEFLSDLTLNKKYEYIDWYFSSERDSYTHSFYHIAEYNVE